MNELKTTRDELDELIYAYECVGTPQDETCYKVAADALLAHDLMDAREGLRLHDLASPFDEVADSVAILKEYLEDYEQSAFAQTIAQLRGNRETWFTIKLLRDNDSKICGFMVFDASEETSVRAAIGMEALK